MTVCSHKHGGDGCGTFSYWVDRAHRTAVIAQVSIGLSRADTDCRAHVEACLRSVREKEGLWEGWREIDRETVRDDRPGCGDSVIARLVRMAREQG